MTRLFHHYLTSTWLSGKITKATSLNGNLTGKWSNDHPLLTIELELSRNGDFRFSSGSCLGSIYSTGKWIRGFGFLILQSDDSLQKNQVVPNNLSDFA